MHQKNVNKRFIECTLQCDKYDTIFFYDSFNIIYANNINLIARKARKNEEKKNKKQKLE